MLARCGGHVVRLGLALLATLATTSAAMPAFLPKPNGIFERFTALKEPRADMPVGALWVQDYGAVGEGASADNLVTVKSLTGVALSRELQVSLTAGVLNLFDIDPGVKSNYSARFSNLTIVQVKDVDKLAGPAGEFRIVEALRAGTITVTTDKDLGLDIRSGPGAQPFPVIGRGNSGLGKTWTIDGSDMFIAFRVARVRTIRSREETAPVRVNDTLATATFGDYEVALNKAGLDACACGATLSSVAPSCDEKSVKARLHRGVAGDAATASSEIELPIAVGAPPMKFELPVPKADKLGGLYTTLEIVAELAFKPASAPRAVSDCAYEITPKSRLIGRYVGRRDDALPDPKAPNW